MPNTPQTIITIPEHPTHDPINRNLSVTKQIQHYIIQSPTTLSSFIFLSSISIDQVAIIQSPDYIHPLNNERNFLVSILSPNIPNDNLNVECLISECNQTISKKDSFNMFRHFVSKHKDEIVIALYLSRILSNNILRHLKNNNNITTNDDKIFKKIIINKSKYEFKEDILNMILSSSPFIIFHNNGFKGLLEPYTEAFGFKVNRNNIFKVIMEKHEEVVHILITTFRRTLLASSMDCGVHKRRKFLSLNCHLIVDGGFKTMYLGMIKIKEICTGGFVVNKIEELLKKIRVRFIKRIVYYL